jgi:L-ascorbate metabolism protein UlaG (beta-lactamase superfamily)
MAMQRMTDGGPSVHDKRLVSLVAALAALLGAPQLKAEPAAGADRVRARQLFFGAENVNARTGEVDPQKVIFSWITNSSLAVSVKGKVVLLDSYVHRAETAPGRTPFVVDDLVSLRPEAIFLGHGHFDHADNAAFIAGKLDIPIYASQETCAAMQADAMSLFLAGEISLSAVKCVDVTSTGSTPGAQIVVLPQLEPVACITAFRHLHSTRLPADTELPLIPVDNIADPRDATLYPQGVARSFPSTGGRGPGGPIAIFFHFALRGDNRFAFAWHNTSGALKEGCGNDFVDGVAGTKCWGPEVGQHLADLMRALPPTDLVFGSMVSVGFATNGMRDPILYQLALRPKIYIPVHQTNAALPTSSLQFKESYLKQWKALMGKAVMGVTVTPDLQPEARWMVDPNDYLRPMVYDPKDPRWAKPSGRPASTGYCN